jgi:hypothetical protein
VGGQALGCLREALDSGAFLLAGASRQRLLFRVGGLAEALHSRASCWQMRLDQVQAL